MLKYSGIMLIFLFAGMPVFAQEVPAKQDSVSSEQSNEELQTSYVMTKSPTSALWRSVIPGWGQLYNEDYWKAPILFGAAATLTGLIIYYNGRFQDNTAALESATDPNSEIEIENPGGADDPYYLIGKRNLSRFELQQLKSNREFNRDNRDMSALYLIGVYVVAAVDAYVGANLYDFNVDEDLGFNAKVMGNGTPALCLSYSF